LPPKADIVPKMKSVISDKLLNVRFWE